ncbi:tetratricopeptide repeat protein [Rhizobium sp. G187]|uniref:tetratricopeptide repeat protein n=1 Tax=Rhizobium sp. G187 TaxID=3451352 RepID=UPI003EE45A04
MASPLPAVSRFSVTAAVNILAVLTTVVGSPALAQSSENVAPRTGELSADAIQAERDRLFQLMMERPDDLDVAFQYAALSSRAGDLEGAISTLERMLIYAPGLPRLQLELGVLYFRLGAYETARQYFDATLAGPDVPAEVQTRVAQYIAAIDRQGSSASDFAGSVRTGLRYQSNANAGPTNSTVTLNGLPYLVDDLTVAGEDVNAYANGSVRYRHDLDEQGIAIEAGVSGYAAGYDKRDTLNTAAAEVYLGPTFDLARFGLDDRSLSVFLVSSGVLLEGDRYLGSLGASTTFDWQISPIDAFSFQFTYRYEDYTNTKTRLTAEQQSGNRFDTQVSYSRYLTENLSVTGRLLASRKEARDGYLASSDVGAVVSTALRYTAPVGEGPAWILALDAGVSRRNYDDPDIMINAQESQQDTELTLNLRQIMPFTERVALVTEAGYRKVWSNYDIKAFDNITLSVGVQSAF